MLLDEQIVEKDRLVLTKAKLEAEADAKYQGKEAAALEKREQEAKDFLLDRYDLGTVSCQDRTHES